MWDLPDSTQAEDMFKVLLSTIRCGYQHAPQPGLQCWLYLPARHTSGLHYVGPLELMSGRSSMKSTRVMCCCDVQPHATGVLTACSEKNENAVQPSMAGVSDLVPEAVLEKPLNVLRAVHNEPPLKHCADPDMSPGRGRQHLPVAARWPAPASADARSREAPGSIQVSLLLRVGAPGLHVAVLEQL